MTDPLASRWEDASVNPDPADDLGYEYDPLTAIYLSEYDGQYVFLPGREESLTDAEFLVVPTEHVCDLESWR